MVIANPIYDVVFKRMMENKKVARFFIGTLLGQTIESVEVHPQEYTGRDKEGPLTLFRLDYIATIKIAKGVRRKVLIEVQKARDRVDLIRFRNYLGSHYKITDPVDNKEEILPIITIYVLGYKLPKIKTACFRVGKKWEDLIDKKPIYEKDEDIEKLTHECYVVQVERIEGKPKSRLDKLLSVFEQKNFLDEKRIIKEYPHKRDLKEIKMMTDILHDSGVDPAERKKIEDEKEFLRYVDFLNEPAKQKFLDALNKKEKALAEKDKALGEKDKALGEKDKALGEKDKALGEKDKVIDEKDKALSENKKALSEKDKVIAEMARQMEELKRKRGEK